MTFDEDKQYLSGHFRVKDGVRLRLPKSATILAGSKVGGIFHCKPLMAPSSLIVVRGASSLVARQPGNFMQHCTSSSRITWNSLSLIVGALCQSNTVAGLQRENYPKSYADWYLILFECQNCGVEGEGRIDAQGTLWTYGGCALVISLVISSNFTSPLCTSWLLRVNMGARQLRMAHVPFVP